MSFILFLPLLPGSGGTCGLRLCTGPQDTPLGRGHSLGANLDSGDPLEGLFGLTLPRLGALHLGRKWAEHTFSPEGGQAGQVLNELTWPSPAFQ